MVLAEGDLIQRFPRLAKIAVESRNSYLTVIDRTS